MWGIRNKYLFSKTLSNDAARNLEVRKSIENLVRKAFSRLVRMVQRLIFKPEETWRIQCKDSFSRLARSKEAVRDLGKESHVFRKNMTLPEKPWKTESMDDERSLPKTRSNGTCRAGF